MRNRRLHLLRAIHSGRAWLLFAAWLAIVLVAHEAPRDVDAVAALSAVAVIGVVRTVWPRAEAPRASMTRARRLVA
jgi:hypothetical protein